MPTIKKLLTVAPRMRNSMPRKAQKGDTITVIKGSISPVPNGPLVKKKGPYAGSTLKSGGKLVPKKSNVSKKLGSAKSSIGNMRFTKKKK
jgi:hypothetical protein